MSVSTSPISAVFFALYESGSGELARSAPPTRTHTNQMRRRAPPTRTRTNQMRRRAPPTRTSYKPELHLLTSPATFLQAVDVRQDLSHRLVQLDRNLIPDLHRL